MRVRVLLFGAEARAAGRESVEVDAGEAPTCAELVHTLGECCPSLHATLPSARLAVNHAFAGAEQVIRPGDEVALIGPVSGG